jgi:hypothetical protein
MRDGGGMSPGHFSEHSNTIDANLASAKLAKKYKDDNFHVREKSPRDRPYKEHEHPYWAGNDGKPNK